MHDNVSCDLFHQQQDRHNRPSIATGQLWTNVWKPLNLCWIARQWPKEFHRPKRPSKLDAREYRPSILYMYTIFQWNNNNNNNNRVFCHTFSKRDLWESSISSIRYSTAQNIAANFQSNTVSILDTFIYNKLKKRKSLSIIYLLIWSFPKNDGDIKYPKEFYKVPDFYWHLPNNNFSLFLFFFLCQNVLAYIYWAFNKRNACRRKHVLYYYMIFFY